MTVFYSDADGIRLPNNNKSSYKVHATRLFFSELCNIKTEKLAKKKPRYVGKTMIKFIRYRKLDSLHESKFSWNVERWKNTKRLRCSDEYIFS